MYKVGKHPLVRLFLVRLAKINCNCYLFFSKWFFFLVFFICFEVMFHLRNINHKKEKKEKRREVSKLLRYILSEYFKNISTMVISKDYIISKSKSLILKFRISKRNEVVTAKFSAFVKNLKRTVCKNI